MLSCGTDIGHWLGRGGAAAPGADSNSGSSVSPWRTLQHAADTVQAGDTVIVRGGYYAGFTLSTSGTATAPITFNSQGAIINSGGSGGDRITLQNASHVSLLGFSVFSAPNVGI